MLAEDMGRFYADPVGFARYAYEWGKGELAGFHGPDDWQCDFLADVGQLVRARNFDGVNPVAPIRMGAVSGHGVGKSALVAMLVDWIMSTRPFAKGVITANTYEQLNTKTWAEIAKWTKRCITGHWFDVSTGALWMRHKDFAESWRVDGQTCKEHNSEAFAGLHAVNSTPFYIFDEASAVPDKIWEVAEGGTTDGEPMWFAFGNGTRSTGRFREACVGRFKHMWNMRSIDSRDCRLPNKALIKEWIETYGLDSDFVKVRVRGMFPSLSVKQYISTDDVDRAFGKILRPEQFVFAPKILTLDNAWEGDDEGVIGLRQGLSFRILRTFAKNDNDIWVANLLAQFEDEEKADAVFIDGGYGTGVVSAGRTLGRSWRLVWFSEESTDPGCLNKRAQMWKGTRDWLKEGGAIPADQVLYNDLIGPETVPRLDGKLQLESKQHMKDRGLPSPGRGDALALSFAHPVACKSSSYEEMVMEQRNNQPEARYWSERNWSERR